MCKKMTLKTNLCLAAVFWALLAVSSQAATIGAGSDITATTLDTDGPRLNIEKEYSRVLPSGTYDVSEFVFNASAGSGGGFMRPFVAKQTSSSPLTYETVWVGQPVPVTVDGVDTVNFASGAETFTLSQRTEVFGGVYHDGTAKLYCVLNIGTTDHDNSSPTEPTGAGQTVSNFSHGNLNRTYAFEINVLVPYVSQPSPADGAFHEDTWANLSWRAGDFAVSHDVYFGDNFDDVNAGAEGTFIGNQDDTFFVVGFPGFPYPDGLVPGTTYYWRIDEVNDAEPNSPWKGDVWSFTVPPRTAYLPDPADGGESASVDVSLSWTPGFGAKLHTVYFGDNFDEVDNATGGLPQGTLNYSPGTLKMAKTYYWRVDEFDAIETYKGTVWSFTTDGAVESLNPVNGAVDVTQTPILTWAPGFGASHEIYFGTDATSLELKGSGNLGSESYETGQLEWNTTYYWRVDEANNANTDSPWTGPLWSFTTANFLIIDDIESYNDIDEGEPGSNRIYNAWVDGFDDPTNGSQVGHLDPPFYEETIVHGGNKSMPIVYDNAVGKSEATLTLTDKRDWTVNGVNALTIWFRGEIGNAAEQMYVVLNGNTRVDHDNPDAATTISWTEWNIDLQAFADQGVNLANVNSITLGLSSVTGGTGMMYFDDIRLYPPEP